MAGIEKEAKVKHTYLKSLPSFHFQLEPVLIWHCPQFCVNRKLQDSGFILES